MMSQGNKANVFARQKKRELDKNEIGEQSKSGNGPASTKAMMRCPRPTFKMLGGAFSMRTNRDEG